MRKALLGAVLIGLVGVVACQPVKQGAPDPKDVLIVGDSIAGGLGCYVFGDIGSVDVGVPITCQGQPDISVANGWKGACTISGGWIQLWNRSTNNLPACWDYSARWKELVDRHSPRLVILWTSGWEIMNRWSELPPGCDPGFILLCPAADRQWGNPLDNNVLANAQQAYRSNLLNAVNILSSRGAKVLILNSPYMSPLLPGPASSLFAPELLPQVPSLDAVWYEAYLLPVDPLPNLATPFGPSKLKVENFNATLDAIRRNDYGGGTGNVQFFDVWRYFSPPLTPVPLPIVGDKHYSQLVCPYPRSEEPLTSCLLDPVNARYGADGGHLTVEGYKKILEPYLMPKVREMLG